MNILENRLYKLRVGEKNNHYLEPSDYCFEINGRDYGDINEQVELFYKSYSTKLGSMGVMLTGSAGTGKTRMAEKLCNIGLKHNMPVVIVTDMKTSIETVNYIAMLRNVVILFDEFGKNFNRDLQDKMLSMFSGVSSGKKLFIITENDTNMISNFILNRPGRVRYHLDFTRLDEDILIEYCSVHGISKEMFKNIYRIYEKANIFSFDHLQAMVSEILFTPEHSFETIMKRLNLSLFDPKRYISLEGVFNKEDVKLPLKTNGERLQLKAFQRGARVYISGNIPLPVPDKKEDIVKNNASNFDNSILGNRQPHQLTEYVNINVSKDDIVEVLEEGYVCKVDDYKVVLNIV